MRNIQFAREEFYHIFNRGVDGRKIFLDGNDYRRFYTSLYLFNDAKFKNFDNKQFFKSKEKLSQLLESGYQVDPLVKIFSFCLLPNHFHLFVEQVQDGGIPKFMHRLGMGYARYFNLRRTRKGRLFESNFKAVHVERDAQFQHLLRYIHLNVLDLTNFDWRNGHIDEWKKAEKYLNQYQWSSHNVYNGQAQALPVVSDSVLRQIFSTPKKYRDFLKEWSGRMYNNFNNPSLSDRHLVTDMDEI